MCYRKGQDNGVADALSCRPISSTDQLFAITNCAPAWLEDVKKGYELDPQTKTIIDELQEGTGSHPNFSLDNGILKYKNRVWIGRNEELQRALLSAGHDTTIGGHSGTPATYQRLRQIVAWPK